jgi:hypothetical protein
MVFVGGNRFIGGKNRSLFFAWATVAGADFGVDFGVDGKHLSLPHGPDKSIPAPTAWVGPWLHRGAPPTGRAVRHSAVAVGGTDGAQTPGGGAAPTGGRCEIDRVPPAQPKRTRWVPVGPTEGPIRWIPRMVEEPSSSHPVSWPRQRTASGCPPIRPERVPGDGMGASSRSGWVSGRASARYLDSRRRIRPRPARRRSAPSGRPGGSRTA